MRRAGIPSLPSVSSQRFASSYAAVRPMRKIRAASATVSISGAAGVSGTSRFAIRTFFLELDEAGDRRVLPEPSTAIAQASVITETTAENTVDLTIQDGMTLDEHVMWRRTNQ
jgi:hypothetical protein